MNAVAYYHKDCGYLCIECANGLLKHSVWLKTVYMQTSVRDTQCVACDVDLVNHNELIEEAV